MEPKDKPSMYEREERPTDPIPLDHAPADSAKTRAVVEKFRQYPVEQPVLDVQPSAKVHIVSDGTPNGTHVTADGKPLETTHVVFEIGIDGLAKATITLYVDKVDVLADVVGISGQYTCTGCHRTVVVDSVRCDTCSDR